MKDQSEAMLSLLTQVVQGTRTRRRFLKETLAETELRVLPLLYAESGPPQQLQPLPESEQLPKMLLGLSPQTSLASPGAKSTEIKFQSCDEEGNIYEGFWVKKGDSFRKHGKGKQIFANGNIYDGEWKEDIIEGEGKMIFNSGNIYEGKFKNNKRHGFGKLTFKACGDFYEGEWVDDKMTGKGKYFYANEKKEFEGDFVEGSPYGMGTMKSNEFNYQGSFKSGLFEGFGKLQDIKNRIVFEGYYFDGKKKGYGKLIDLNKGEVYEG
eukprot:CAMPEP_0170541810 /NCGR_PEP_ID=MMETSP0211-20121228/1436_1 /TAXON_ID=311385 /ORGANISM="Pseudokeronopsis sp., Strain OXSARD2" /LENGTH=265 /DNA_ID=CAMNT_0010844673 /DNA_START=1200 /DNA_END=1999 /DNA_ORIENTATION=+